MPSDKIKKKIAINDEQKLALTYVLEKKIKKKKKKLSVRYSIECFMF